MDVDIERAQERLKWALSLPNQCPYKKDVVEHWQREIYYLMMQKLFGA